jgi:1-phosphofructokinase family hexose kinase
MVMVMCANAGVDRVYEVDNFSVGQYHQPRRYRVLAGGKGVNVARTLRIFGCETMLTGFAGGLGARFIQQQMLNIGVQPFFVTIAEESRVCINIVDSKSRAQTRVDEIGPLVTPSEVQALRRRWARLLERAKVAVISGSVPRGVPLDLYADLITVARRARVPVLLDARENMLTRSLAAKPALLKPNLQELQEVMGRTLSVPEGVVEAANEIVSQGVHSVVVTMGAQGCIAVNARGERYWAKPPQVELVSDVGSGDAMMGGIAAAIASGKPLAEQLRWGVGAGAANAATFGPCTFERDLLQQCIAGATIIPLTAEGKPIQEEAEDGTKPKWEERTEEPRA